MLGQRKSQQKCLLLDIGNTSIKYAWYGYPDDIADLHILRTSMDSLADLLFDATVCYFCSVKSDGVAAEIHQLCGEQGVNCEQIHTQESQFGLRNAYKLHRNMGTDRWLAMLAGGALSHNNYVVIDAGTAITCDFVVNNQHKGGWIAPGLTMARESVVKNTHRVFDNQTLPYKLDVGTDTPDCVALGALAQLTGMLVQAISIMRGYQSKFDVFMSGGDAPLLIDAFSSFQAQLKNSQQLNAPINYLENLVLIGLARIAHQKASTIG